MAFTYKLDSVQKLGNFDEKYGQAYWCTSTDEAKALKFNSQNQEIRAGDTISAEESVNKRSVKGTDYLQLRKVKVAGQVNESAPAQTMSVSGDLEMLQRIKDTFVLVKENNELLRRLAGEMPTVTSADLKAAPGASTKAVDDVFPVTDEPINLEDIPF